MPGRLFADEELTTREGPAPGSAESPQSPCRSAGLRRAGARREALGQASWGKSPLLCLPGQPSSPPLPYRDTESQGLGVPGNSPRPGSWTAQGVTTPRPLRLGWLQPQESSHTPWNFLRSLTWTKELAKANPFHNSKILQAL